MKTATKLALVVLFALVALSPAQRGRRDPLTEAETEQLREVSPESDKKLKLYVKFAAARMQAIEQLRAEPQSANRGKRFHSLLEDLTSIVDELDDNVSGFAQHQADLRKLLKEIIQMDTGFQLKLGALKDAASDPKLAGEAKDYEFALASALDSVEASLETTRGLLDKEEAAAKEGKEKKKKR